MIATGEALLSAVLDAVNRSGVPTDTTDVRARVRLEHALEVAVRPMRCSCCFDLDIGEGD